MTDQSTIHFAIYSVAFGSKLNYKHHIKMVSSRKMGNFSIQLWHAIDVLDFSSFRSFVLPVYGVDCTSAELYEVDFLSRHEIIPPMSISNLPVGWEKWSFVYKNQLIITNRNEFCANVMTADMIVALPTYRFDFLCDDVQSRVEDGADIVVALEAALESVITGYSYCKFNTKNPENGAVKMFSLEGLINTQGSC